MTFEWITSRRPTETDGDQDGDVFVCAAPNVDDGCPLHWSHVGEGVPWEHTVIWKPPAPAPAPAAPAPVVSKPAIAFGQTWRRRDGEVVTIDGIYRDHALGRTHPFTAGGGLYTPEGFAAAVAGVSQPFDLIELISEAPTPRKFAAPPRRTILDNGDHIIDVIDDDGTAWWMRIDNSPHHPAFPPPEPVWQQLTPLPANSK